MASRHESTQLLKQGHSIAEIARLRGLSVSTVVQHLLLQVGEGKLKRSDVLFGIKPEARALLESLIKRHERHSRWTLEKDARKHGFDWYELNLYLSLRDARVPRGDMYEYVSDIELTLHKLVRDALTAEYGPSERDWWRDWYYRYLKVSRYK